MSRRQLAHCYGATYHVTSRGNNKQAIFFDDEDREIFLHLLKSTVNVYECHIHAYCLMTNHVHLLVQVGSVAINRIMHMINWRYATWINKKYDRIGHVFQGRYQAQTVSSHDYLVRLIRYIHRNPVKAKMVEKADEYIWSSHGAYLGKKIIPWLSIHWVLMHFSCDSKVAIEKYMAFVDSATQEAGDENIIDEINKKNMEAHQTLVRKPGHVKYELAVCRANLDSIISFSCQQFNSDMASLKSASRLNKHVNCRSLIICLAQDFRIATGVEVAHTFNRNPCSLLKVKNKFAKNNEEFLIDMRDKYMAYIECKS